MADGTETAGLLSGLHTTPMGAERIKRNLRLAGEDAVEYCRAEMTRPGCTVARRGKNLYFETDRMTVTVNAYSNTIITAHMKRNAPPSRMTGPEG